MQLNSKSGKGCYKTSGIGGSPQKTSIKNKKDNNSDENQHNKKICVNSSLTSNHIISTSTLLQISVYLFQGRRRWLCQCTLRS